MSMVDSNNILFKIAHPDIYMRNPFNLLNLSINATPKDIRRRKEDIEAAFNAGTVENEFQFVLPLDASRKPPTQDVVNEAFLALENPEMRLAYSLFWFWPEVMPSNFQAKRRKISSCPNGEIDDNAISTWETIASGNNSEAKAIACHNLSIFNHLIALAGENALLSTRKKNSSDYKNKLHAYWHEGVRYWNIVAASTECWHFISELVTYVNDPRIDYRFARSMRDQFAYAFDQINVELAISFAKCGGKSNALRQIEYMKLSQPDADDVEGTLDDAFAVLLRQTEAIVKTASEETRKNPKEGLSKCDEIINRVEETVRVSRIVLSKGASIREAIITTIFNAVRGCMVAYGNATNDWDGCLQRIIALKALAENKKQLALVEEDLQIITKNKEQKDEEETCWFCKQRYTTTNPRRLKTIPFWGNLKMGTTFGQVSFSKVSVNVHLCSQCYLCADIKSHPNVSMCIKEGWEYGEEPPQSEIKKIWGISRPNDLFPSPDDDITHQGILKGVLNKYSGCGCQIIGTIIFIIIASLFDSCS